MLKLTSRGQFRGKRKGHALNERIVGGIVEHVMQLIAQQMGQCSDADGRLGEGERRLGLGVNGRLEAAGVEIAVDHPAIQAIPILVIVCWMPSGSFASSVFLTRLFF